MIQVLMSPVKILKRAAKLYVQKNAVLDGELLLTYVQMQARANQVAHAVRDLDLPTKSRIAVQNYNTHQFTGGLDDHTRSMYTRQNPLPDH